jgi:queuosine precursor transporter
VTSNATANGRDDQTSSFVTITVLIVGYFFVQVGANLTVLKTTPIGFGQAIPVGSLLYAFSFTWIDLVNQRLGRRNARVLVIASVLANACLAIWFQLYIALPGTEAWEVTSENQTAVEIVLGSVPRVLAASLLTNLLVENADIAAYHLVRTRAPGIPLWMRSAASNTVSAPLDGLLFAVLAFGGTVSTQVLFHIAGGGMLYKLAVSYVSVPLVYAIRRRRPDRLVGVAH